MYRCFKKNAITVIKRGRNAGNPAIQQQIVEELNDMDINDIKEFLKTRALDISGSSESVDPKSGETTLYLGINKFGKATYAENLGAILKGKIKWNHLILDGLEVF